jgi:hypothetical protein
MWVVFEEKPRVVFGFQGGTNSSADSKDASYSLPRHWQREFPNLETKFDGKFGKDSERFQQLSSGR